MPKLGTLIQIALSLDISVASFFDRDTAHNEILWQSAAEYVKPILRVDINRSTEELRDFLREASAEIQPPRLRDVTIRLGYKSTERLYQADSKLCKLISSNYVKSGRSHSWKKPEGNRISDKHDLRKLLEESLNKDVPESSAKLAERLGYANESYLRTKYPDLCNAIAKKIAEGEQRRKSAERIVLSNAIEKYPVPSLESLRKQLGYASSTSLRYNYPDLCNAMDIKRTAERNQFLNAKKKTLHTLLEHDDLYWQEIVQAVGSRFFIRTYFPDLYSQLANKCSSFRKDYRARGMKELRDSVTRAVNEIISSGRTPTVNGVREILPPGIYRGQISVAKAIAALNAV